MLGASSYHVKPSDTAALRQMLATLNAYWLMCEMPEVDSSGKQLATDSTGKLGERFTQPCNEADASTKACPERV